MIAVFIAATSLIIWIILVLAHGWFWTGWLDPTLTRTEVSPSVSVIVPARNEAELISPVIESLLTQHYPGSTGVILVDDHSSDETRQRAAATATRLASDRLSVVVAASLPVGWKGKMWALREGLRAAEACQPSYYLFADADIVHSPDSIQNLVANAESGPFDLVSCMVKLHCKTFAERAIIPAFSFFFFMLYPPRWVSDSHRRKAAAAGGCILIRCSALSAIGGIEAIRDELIDDSALARAVKRAGGSIWLGQTSKAHSLRAYNSFSEIARLISRTAFSQLNHSSLLLAGTVVGLTITYLIPPVSLFMGGWAAIFGAGAWMLMSAAYWPTLRFYRLSPAWAPFLPLVALFYLGATVLSAVDYWRGFGGQWKGRVQDPIPRPNDVCSS